MGIPYAQSGSVYPFLDFRKGVCDGPQVWRGRL